MPTGRMSSPTRRHSRRPPWGIRRPAPWRIRSARRWLVILTVVTTWWLTSVPAAATGHPASVSWPAIWDWLTQRHPSLSLPVQQHGSARGLPHHVPASVTRAGRGSGRPPGRGRGQLPPFRRHGPAYRRTTTGPAVAGGSSSFSPLTSRPVMSKATATSTLYHNADGSYTRHVYPGPVNFKGTDGAWHPISTRLTAGAGGRLQEVANSLAMTLAPSAASPRLVSAGFGAAGSVSYGLAGAADVPAQVSGSTATYPGVLPQTDLAVSTVASGFEQSFVLHSPAAPSAWVLPLRLHGLAPHLQADGSITLTGASGATVARIPPAFMQDSSFRKGPGPAVSTAVRYSLITDHGQPAIQMTASRAWLDSPARVYPVTVDPNFTTTGTTYVMYPVPEDDSGFDDLLVGTWDNGGQIGNSFIAFNGLGSALAGEHISSASLNLFDMEAATCTPEPFYVGPVTQSWPVTGSKTYPGPSHGAAIGSATLNPGPACTNTSLNTSVGTWMNVGLSTGTFNSWTTGGADNGLAVWAATTGDLSWKRFDSINSPNPPYLTLNYTPDVPPQINSQYPPDNVNSPTLTPELLASGTDPDNWPAPLKYNFTVYSTSGSVIATSGNIATGDWVVPAGKLTWGQTYYWSVQAYDGFDYSTGLNAHYFTTSVPQPLITSTLAQNTGGHGFDPSVGNYTTSATDAKVQTAGPSLSVDRDYNSLDPRVPGAFGAGWSSLYDMKATEITDASGTVTSVVITYPDGSEVGFGDDNGTFSPPPGRFATLAALPNHGGYTLTDKNGTTYRFGQPAATGVFAISSISDYQGRAESFSYSGGQLTTATSGVSNRALHFTWSTPAGAQFPHVASVTTDPATPGQPATALTWTYGYSGDSLTSVCPPGPAGACTTYSYGTGSHFPTAVLDAGPAAYWRMGEASGTTATDSVTANEGVYNGTYSGVTLGQPGPLPGSTATAAAFDGTSSYMQLPASLAGNASYLAGGYLTVSMWFKTTSDNEVLFGSSSNPITSEGGSTPGPYTPSLYVGSDGKLNGEFWGGTTPISSAPPVNDGNWHYAVLTAAGNTESLYLDGSLAGTQSTHVGVTGQPYVYVGTGYLGGAWPDESHPGQNGIASYFNGEVSDVAMFSHYLPAPAVAALYATGHSAAGMLTGVTTPAGNQQAQISYSSLTDRVTSVTDANGGTWGIGAPTVAGSSQVYRSAVLGAAPAGYWRLGDTGNATQAADEVSGGPGSYGNVTLGVAGPFSDNTAASFNGTSSYVSLPPADAPATAGPGTIGLWFMVPKGNTTGGVLYDYESNPLNYPGQPTGNWVPALYVGTDGKLRGEFWNGTAAPVTSATAVNDGAWHYAVLAGSASGQSLYLDGSLVGTIPAGTGSPASYVYVGAGVTAGNWPGHSASLVSYFTGSIAEVAYYRSQLGAAQVLAQWRAAKSSSGLSPTETVHVTDPGGNTLSYGYDPLQGNRLLAETDALGNRTSYGYDTSGFLYTTTQPDGNMIITGHDVRGNMVSQTTCQNQAANQCSTQYYTYYPDDTSAALAPDPRNDLILTMRDGRSSGPSDNRYLTSYAYDAAGNQTSAATPPVPGFPNGRTTTMTYTKASTPAVGGGTTPAGLLASTTTPGGATETIGYYANGDVATVTDPAGEATSYTYDGLGRVLSKTVTSNSYPGGLTTSYTYDGQNRVLTETDPAVTDHVTGAVHTARTTNTYDADGNLTSVTVADLTGGDASRSTAYTFDSHDRMASKTDAAGNTTTFGYDAYGNQISQTGANGDTTDYAYDPNGHLLSVTLAGYTGDPASPSAPVNLAEQSRAYDPDGRLATITDSMGRQTSYTYTDNGLTATVTRSSPATGQSFTVQSNYYDAAGNLIKRLTNNGTTTTTYAVDAANRTDSTTLDPSGLDRVTTNVFSPDDFVLNTTVSNGTAPVSVTDATYDPLGRRTSQTIHNDLAGHPVAWWPLSDGANATASYSPAFAADSSGSGNTAFLAGSGPGWASGAATFNGTSGMLATAGPVLDTAKSYSVSAWVNLASDTPGDAVSQGGTTISSFAIQYSSGYGGWSFTSASADSASHSFYSAHLSTKPAVGVWTHLTGVFDASTHTMSLYLNGALAATGSNPTPWSGSGPMTIGGDQQAGGAQSGFFAGQIANVQVYQRALSASEVAALYGAGRPGAALGAKPLTTTWTLDQRGLPTSMTDPAGNTTSYLYDEAGKVAEVTAPAVSTETGGGTPVTVHPITSYGYDTFGERVSAEDPNGNITTTNYDADGRPVAQILPPYTPPGGSAPITATATRAYDAIGELTSATDALGNTTSYTYDQLGDVATITQPGGGVTHYTYDTNGERLSATNPLGAQTQATYDYLGRQLTATQIVRQPALASYTSTRSYNQAGYLSSATSAAGVTTGYAYDAAGEVTGVTDGAGNTTRYGYDALGRRTVATLPDGTSQQVSYDGAGNAVGMTSEDASGAVLRQTSASYDGNGDVTAATDAMGNTTTFSYNALGQPTQEVQPASSTSSITTSFGYDAAGNRTRYTDGNGNATVYTYNNWNLPESTILPATAAYPALADRTFTTAYDADGHPVQQTSPGGVTVTAAYDALGDVTTQSGSGADAPTTARSFGYNSAGELTSASAPGGTDTFSYDDRGLLLSATGPSGASSFSYSPDGQMTSQTTAAGTSSYTYDGAGRLAGLTDAATGTTLTYGYNADSLLTSLRYGTGGALRTFSYDALHQLTGDTLTSPAGQTEASISYGYNANGDETSKTTTGFAGASASTYTYDQANRLTSWNDGSATVSYGYDAAGNRTQAGAQAFSYDARDELLSGGGNSYSYTARGTLASVTGASGTISTAFDAFGQLVTHGTQAYSYDALGRVVTGQGAAFSYSGLGNQAASDGSYSYSRDPGGGLIGISGGPGAVLAMTDRHFDVVGEFTATGTALAGSTSYGPLGNILATAGAVGNLGYQSGWTDPATGKVNMTSRWYDPASGQFLSRDAAANSPIPASVAANAFAYGSDNPLTAYDPLGTCNLWDLICGAKQLIHGASNTVSQAWNTVTTAVGTGFQVTGQIFQNYMSQIPAALTWVATQAVHVATAVVNTVQDAYHTAVNVVHNVYNGAVSVVHSAYTKVTTAVAATYHAVKYAVSTATQFVQHHAAAIVSFVASTAVFLGCDAAADALAPVTAGVSVAVGAVGCGALAGAVGNVVTYAMSTPVSKWSIGGFAGTALMGAAAGAVAGAVLGPLGSKLLGPVMDAVGSRLGPAVVDDAASAAGDAADGALDSVASDTGAAADSSASDATASADASASSSADASSSASADANGGPKSEPAASTEDPAQSTSGGSETERARTGQVQPGVDRTLANALNKDQYFKDVADQYGINLRGSGQDISVVSDDSLPVGQLGVTREAEGGQLIRINANLYGDDVNAANTIAHELNHARYLLRNGSFAGEGAHGTLSSLADGTPYGSGNALQDWIEGNR